MHPSQDVDDLIADDQAELEMMDDEYIPDDIQAPTLDLDAVDAGKNWDRPPAPPIDSATTNLVFQQVELDYTIQVRTKI